MPDAPPSPADPPTPVRSSAVCQVQGLSRRDAPVLRRWLSDPQMQAFLEDEPGGAVGAARKVLHLVGCDPVRDREAGYIVRYDGHPIGFIHLKEINWISRTGEIDVLVDQAVQRSLKGLWVVAKIAEVAFDQLNLRKLYGYIFASNPASLRLFQRLGTIEATLTAARRPRTGDEDILIAALTVERYRELRQRYRWDAFTAGRGPRR